MAAECRAGHGLVCGVATDECPPGECVLDACPDDPDGQHHIGCGCDHARDGLDLVESAKVAHTSPELDPHLLTSELDACRTEIGNLRRENDQLATALRKIALLGAHPACRVTGAVVIAEDALTTNGEQ